MNAYILVGGRSSRMGHSKPDLPFAGSTFLDRVLDAARPVFEEVVIVAGRAESPSYVGRALSPPDPWQTKSQVRAVVEPPHEDVAPIFGVVAALADVGTGRAFILAADYPLITSDLLRYIRMRADASPSAVVVPQWNGKLQTLCAVYDASLAPRLTARIGERRYDLRGLIDEAGGEIIAESDIRARFAGEPLMNVNTPEELEAARRFL